jgi:hypothetical protein
MPRTTASMVNEIEHGVGVKLENTIVRVYPSMFCPSHDTPFIDFYNSSDDEWNIP